MNKRTSHTIRLAFYSLAILLAGSFILAGCGEDDPVAPPKDYGFSPVTFLHVNTGLPTGVTFLWGDSTPVSSQSPIYGEFFKATVPNGESQKYTVKGLDGSTLATTTGAHDSSQYATVIFSGNVDQREVFVASTKKINPSGGKVAVRFVHAARDAGPRALKIGSPDGAPIASNIAYKGSSGAYISINADTDVLSIVDDSEAKDPINIPVNLTVGKAWTVIFHGSENAVNPEYRWKATLIADE